MSTWSLTHTNFASSGLSAVRIIHIDHTAVPVSVNTRLSAERKHHTYHTIITSHHHYTHDYSILWSHLLKARPGWCLLVKRADDWSLQCVSHVCVCSAAVCAGAGSCRTSDSQWVLSVLSVCRELSMETLTPHTHTAFITHYHLIIIIITHYHLIIIIISASDHLTGLKQFSMQWGSGN